MAANLSEPIWTNAAAVCLACGYSLEGLDPSGKCPECGAPYQDKQLVLTGVARSLKGVPLWRRFAYFVCGVCLFVGSNALSFLNSNAAWILGAMFVFGIVLLIALLVSAPRERRGTERFVLTQVGFARLPLKGVEINESVSSVFVPWPQLPEFEIISVGPVWKRVRIGTPTTTGKIRDCVLDAGFRCSNQNLEMVERGIRGLLVHRGRGTRLDDPTASHA